MKKYTKRLLAFLLATVMVVTGVPMSAKEVKAAAGSARYSFVRPSTGVIQKGDSTNTMTNLSTKLSTSTVFHMTTALKSTSWRLNTAKTTVPMAEGSETIYQLAGTSSTADAPGAHFQKWSGSAENTVLWINYGNTVAFDFDVKEAGTYEIEVQILDRSDSRPIQVSVNGVVIGTTPAPTDTKNFVTYSLGNVYLNGGTNLVEFTSTSNDRGASGISYMQITRVPVGDGYFQLNLTDVDLATTSEASTTYYTNFALGTKSKENAKGVQWVLNTANTAKDFDHSNGKTAGRFFMHYNEVDYLRFMSGAKSLVLDFVAPAAGKYNLVADLASLSTANTDKSGYLSFYVNEVYAGTIDAYTGNPFSQNLLSVDLKDGTNQIRMIVPGKSSGSDDYVSFKRIQFFPVNNDAREITSLEATINKPELDLSIAQKGQILLNYATTNNDVIIVGDWAFSSANKQIATVARTGEVTPVAIGATDLIVNMRDVEVRVPVRVVDSSQKYTIKWLGTEGQEFEIDTDAYAGTTTSFDGVTPTKEATPQYTYTFTGWLDADGNAPAEMVTSDATYYAQFSETVNKYEVKWLDYKDDVIASEEVEFGKLPTEPQNVPSYELEGYNYTFSKWDKKVTEVTGHVEYKAQYEGKKQQYTITWVDYNDELLLEQTYEYGDNPKYPGEDPVRGQDSKNTYKFIGWEPAVKSVTNSETYKAVYEETLRKYTVKFVDENGNLVGEPQIVEYGKMPTIPEVPEKEADPGHVYTEGKWSPEVVAVAGDAEYKATYTPVTRKYTITWKNWNGDVLDTDEVAFATTPVYEGEIIPTRPETPEFTYTFENKWSPEIVPVDGDITYTAEFTEARRNYTITWLNEDGSEFKTEVLPYGAGINAPADLSKDATDEYTYVFLGWKDEDGNAPAAKVTGNAEYKATFESKVNKYTIKFVDDDNAVISEKVLPYGAEIVAPADPTKEATAKYTYTFTGWDREVDKTVKGDRTYKATYSSTVNEYEITFVTNEGVFTETYAYGADPVAPETPDYSDANNAYTFAGWTPAVVAVEGKATYTAEYTATPFVAKVAGVGYTTLAEAFAAADGETVTLVKDVTLTDKLTVTNKVTLNLGGKKLTLAVGNDGNYDIVVKGDLTIEGEGNVYVESTYGIGVTGNLTVNGGTYTTSADNYYVIGSWKTTTINAGEFDVAYMAANGFGGKVAITGGTFKSADADYVIAAMPGCMAVTGGTFDRDVTEYCAEGLAAAPNADGTYGIVETYTIKFVVEGTVVSEAEYVLGATVVVPEDPTKEADGQYTYTFAGWTPTVVPVEGDATYEAVYETTVNEYTITWIVDGKSTTNKVAFGVVPVFEGSTDKAADPQYTYTFAGWTPTVVAVEGPATYEAKYDKTVNEYTVTFIANGEVVAEDVYAYGEMPVAPEVADYSDANNAYTFANWDKTIVTVEGKATYTAVYTATPYAARVNDEGYFTFAEAFAAANDGDVVTLLADVSMSSILSITKAITLDGNGYALTSTAGRAINVDGANGATIKNLTINASGERAINVINGATNVTIDNVTATAANYAVNVAGSGANAVITINGSDLTGLNTVNIAADNAVVNIADTKITSADNSKTESYAAISVNADNVAVAVVGGEVVAEDDSVAANKFGANSTVTFDGTVGATEAKEIVAKIGDAGYYTLQDAVDAAAKNGGAVILNNDIVLTEKLVVNGNVTLNLSGKTLTLAVGDNNNYDVVVKGNLTIEGEGNVVVESTYGIGVTGTLTVNGGTYTTSADAYYVIGNWGSTTINAGNFDVAYMAANGFGGKVAIKGGTFKSADADYVIAAMPGCMEVTGGTFDRDVTEYCAEGLGAAPKADGTYGIEETYTITFVANGEVVSEAEYLLGATVVVPEVEGYEDEENIYTFANWDKEVTAVTGDATYTAVYDAESKYYAASINGVKYPTFAAAYEAAVAGDAIVLNDDLTMSSILTIDKAIELDGNGHKLTSTAGRAINVSGANGVTIKNLTINARGERAINVIGGATNVTIDNVTATAANYAINAAASAANAVITVTGSDLTGLNTVNIAADNAVVTIDDTKITSDDKSEVETYAAINVSTSATVVVNGGEVVLSGESSAASVFGTGSVTFNGTAGDPEVRYVVATISGGGFFTLETAFNYASKNGGTIKLVRDIELDTTVVNTGNVIFDLNGHTITGTDNNVKGNFYLINNSKGNLTIIDSVGGGKMTLTATTEREWSASSVVVANNLGTVTVKSGTIEHLGGTSMAYGIDNLTNGNNTVANLYIEGGKVDSTYFAIRQFANSGTNNLTISGGEVTYAWMQSPNANANVATINVTGGTVEGICLSGNNADLTMNVAAGTTGEVYGTAPTGMVIVGSPETGFGLEAASYTITWIVDGVTTTSTVEHGMVPVFAGSTDKASDAQYSYTFKGWDSELVAATSDATYTAVFEQTVNAYTVTWLDLDGSVLATENYEYGETPEYKGAASKYGEIKGWSPAVEAVTGNATYTVESNYTGILKTVDGELFYYIAGEMQKNAGLVKVDGKLYYVHYSGKIVAGGNQTVSEAKANGLAPAGTYYFREDGTMQYQSDKFSGEIVEVENADGTTTLWYYVDGEVCKNVGLVKLADGNVYYVHYSGKVVVSGNQTVTAEKANTDKTGVAAGTYYFMSNGALKTDDTRFTGGEIIDGMYYVDGKLERNVGLVKLGGKLYYVHYSGKIVKGANQTVTEAKANGFANAGVYFFKEDGSMKVESSDKFHGTIGDDGYYYVDGEICKNVGLVEIDGALYYVHYSGKVVKNAYQTIAAGKSNGHTEVTEGKAYFFGADGALVK